LNLHNVELIEKDKKRIQAAHCNGDMIKYKEALGELHLDLNFAGMGEEKWGLSVNVAKGNSSQVGG
jgi:hypothetical protein